jgi:hypothetical protein
VEAAPAAPVKPPTAPSPTAYPVPAGATEFRSENFESGRTNWLTQAPAGRFTVQNSTAGEGSFSARTEVRPGDPQVASGNRAEISGASHANDELCYGGRFMVPSASTTGSSAWQITYQWHAGSGSPPLALMVTERPGGTFDLKLGHGNSSRTDWTKTGLARDVWHSMFVCVKWGTSGWLEFWFDGAWQTIGPAGPRGVPRKTFATNPVSSSIYWKGGVYRSPTSTGTTIRYIDDLRAFEM